MAIDPSFFRYLQHFGATVQVAALHDHPQATGVVALRHDVDHDLDVALEVAYWEHEQGHRASYYVLPTAGYWDDDPALIDKCLQLQDYGHEVGLHVNILAEWFAGQTSDPATRLTEQLARLRDGGVTVRGLAAHGDRLCYEHSVANDWCFAELRPVNPMESEDYRTAEGPPDPNGSRFVRYPTGHQVRRPDGTVFPLWSISLREHAIDYDAWHTRFDRYFSDSGGTWARTPDPIYADAGHERWQVLMHPIHWRGEPKIYFFLSTARSGSKWLSEVLNVATPLRARHEYILNQAFHRGESAEKATGANFRDLENDSGRLKALITEAWTEIGELKSDYAEVNVYLERFLPLLRTHFPSAAYVHLHRNPAEVVRSLMNREWYDTPEDRRHPRLARIGRASMTQFERVCHYIADVNGRLHRECDFEVRQDQLTSGLDSLAASLGRIGIPLHLRLATSFIGRVINANRNNAFPSYRHWTAAQKQLFAQILGPSLVDLGYAGDHGRFFRVARHHLHGWIYRVWRGINELFTRTKLELVLVSSLTADFVQHMRAENCVLEQVAPQGGTIRQPSDTKAYATLGGSGWHKTVSESGHASGWAANREYYVAGAIQAEIDAAGRIGVFGLSYGADGKWIHRRRLGAMNRSRRHLVFAFATHPDAVRFDIALKLLPTDAPVEVRLREVSLTLKPHRTRKRIAGLRDRAV